MVDITDAEVEAIEYAGQMGGEYLDEIKKTDLATLTQEEYLTFIECVVTSFTDKLQKAKPTA